MLPKQQDVFKKGRDLPDIIRDTYGNLVCYQNTYYFRKGDEMYAIDINTQTMINTFKLPSSLQWPQFFEFSCVDHENGVIYLHGDAKFISFNTKSKQWKLKVVKMRSNSSKTISVYASSPYDQLHAIEVEYGYSAHHVFNMKKKKKKIID